jgi:hypothetical protein
LNSSVDSSGSTKRWHRREQFEGIDDVSQEEIRRAEQPVIGFADDLQPAQVT